MNSIQTANVVLILLGVVLILSGPYILYRTVFGVVQRRREDPGASRQPFSNFLNIVIGVLFFVAGILFVMNNLRGNPFQ
ncbi:MAG: hypothetical protein FJ116_07990 [Deltaproteobacteria bacterium]|nr:hypothetical protein [Deltaproteobacteria bacterium]